MVPLRAIQTAELRASLTAKWRATARTVVLIIVAAMLVAPVPALGRGMSSGPSGGRPAVSFGARHTFGFHRDHSFSHRRFGHLRDSRHFHRGDRREFADWYYPYGFDDWYYPYDWYYRYGYYDAPPYEPSDGGPRMPLFHRYEPATIETSPSGVVIMRGPGSRH